MSCLRLTTSHGEVVREPDRAALAATIEAAGRSGRRAVVVLDGDAGNPVGDAPFLQATRTDGTAWRVEIRRVAGPDADEHFWTVVADDDAVTATFWSWADGTDDWQHLRWHQHAAAPLAAAG